MAEPTTQSQRMWETDLNEQGRKLTPEELLGLEAMHQCKLLQDISQHLLILVMHQRSIEGRLDRLEQYLMRIDKRYPRSGEPQLGLLLVAGGDRP